MWLGDVEDDLRNMGVRGKERQWGEWMEWVKFWQAASKNYLGLWKRMEEEESLYNI